MGLGKVLLKLGQVITKHGLTQQYGRQIGKTAKNGVACYAKSKKGKTVYTLWSNNTKSVVGKKVKCDSPKLTRITTYDAQGNVLAEASCVKKQVGFGAASFNKNAFEVRNLREEFNSLGQTVHFSDITFAPSLTAPRAAVFRNIDGQLSKTYINTLNKNQHTITCV